MAQFIGSKEDFLKFIGGYCKNKVNLITKSKRLAQNKTCEHCKRTGVELESAHIAGQERVTIIENILESNFKIHNNYYNVNLEQFEQHFIECQTPINEHFLFLCSDCHRRYDSGNLKPNITKQTYIKDTPAPQTIPSSVNITKSENESVQDYVKRLLVHLTKNNMLSEQDLLNMQNKEFCQQFFGITYPLLETDENKIVVSGHTRYWKKFKLSNKYFVCSQWWKDNEQLYITNIYRWLNSILNRKNKHNKKVILLIK